MITTEHAESTATLEGLGVRPDTLNDDQLDRLDRLGYLVLPRIVSADWLGELRERLAYLVQREGGAAGHEVGRQTSATMLADLFNKGDVFVRMLRVPPVLAAIHHVLGDFRVSSLNFRGAAPGQGMQGLHSDWGLPRPDGGFRVCNSIWLIDDFTADNGATRVVPGSHRRGRLPADDMPDPMADHPEQRILTGRAGDVIVFNAHLWHSGTQNTSDAERRGMTLAFCRRDEDQQTDQAAHIRKRVYDQLSPAERFLLDV